MEQRAIPSDARPKLPRGVPLSRNEAQSGWVLPGRADKKLLEL